MKKRQNRAWLALVALAALLLHAHPGAAFVTNMFIGVNGVQGFETYPGSPAPVYTPTNYADGWGASNVGIYSRLPIQPDVHSGSNSAWFNKYSTGESAISSPLLSNGAGTVTFWVKAASGTPTNWYALETSTDGSNWVLRDSIRANLTAASWTQFTGTVNRSESAFLRVRVTNELPNSIITKFDDLVISYPPAWVAITNAQSSPGIPNVNDPVSLTVTVVPDGLVSNITVTNFWSYNNGTTNSIAMLTNGVNGWITANAIPGQQAGMVKYYFVAYFQGPDAVSPSTSVTNQFTVNVPAYSSGYRQDSFRVQGGLNTNLWLVDSYSWLGVAQSSNAVTNALVKFRAETTNTPSTTNIWGDLTQSRTLFRIDGTANTSGPDIVIGGTNSGAFIFTFVETNLAYSIDHGVYQSFDAWPTNSATNAGWTSAAGRLIGDSNHTYRGQSAQLPTNGWIQTPSLTQGVGQVVFWYRDNPSNGSPATACRVQTSVDGTTWTNTITNVLVNGGVYQRFALTVEDRNSRYVRLLNDSTEQLCLDDVIVTDPFWAGVVFASLTNAPANPAATNAVTVSAVIAPMAGTSNLTAKLYYRSGSTGVYSMLAMTNSGTTYSNVVAIPPRIGPDGGAGLVQYFVGCTFEGYSSNITSPVYYPADTNNPSSYSIVRSYLVLTNAATLPVTPYTTNTITLGLDILPFAAASNIIATAYYRIGATGAFTSISMATTGGNHFATTSPVPAQSVPGTMLYYYFSATNDGANPIAPTNYPVGGTAAPLPVQIHAVPFSSVYTNLVVTGAGGLNPGMILVSNGLWQGVAQTTNLINPGFWFTGQNGGATNFGAAAQPVTNFPFYGTASGGATNIVLYGTNNGTLVFTFDENSYTWSVLRANYLNFDAWTNGTGGYGTYTNVDGWVLTDGRVTSNSSPDTELAFTNHYRSGILNGGPATNQSLRSPQLANGIGQVSFWYRNAQTNSDPAAGGFTVEVAPATNGVWTPIAAVSNLFSSDYLYFTVQRNDRTNNYLRIRNLTTSNHPALCLDEVIVAEPGAGVSFGAVTNAPANPTATNAVTVSAVITPLSGASITATLYYRSGSTGVYSMLTMTNSGTAYSNAVAIPPRIGPDGGAGLVQYFISCALSGYNSAIISPAYYPPDTNNPSSYSILRSYLVLTNAVALPVMPYTTNTIALGLDILPFAAASNIIATAYYKIGATGAFTSISMATTGGNHFATTSPVPAQSVPGTMLYYYFSATNDGANPIAPTNYPVGGAAAALPVQIHAAPFNSVYTNLVVTGTNGLNPGMILVSNGLWQGVMQVTNNFTNTGFWFTGQNGGATNFGAATQPVTNFPFYGTASGGATNIVLYGTYGTNNGSLVFTFDENSYTWSVLRANYLNFDAWTNGTGGYGTYANVDGWVLTDGRVTSNSSPDAELAFTNHYRSGILNGGPATNQSLRSPQLTNGIGQVSFWYRNAQTNSDPAAGGFTVEVAPATNGVWTPIAAVSNLFSSDYLYFTVQRNDRTNNYLRIRNLATSNHPALCLDEVIIAEPGADIGFSAFTNTPAAPTWFDSVYISGFLTPLAGATGITAGVWYCDNTNAVFEYMGMATTGSNYYVTTNALPMPLPPTTPTGSVPYYIEVSYGGFQAALRSPVQYPAAGQFAPASYNVGNIFQGFETYPGSPSPVYTPTNYADDWGASNVGIYSRLPVQPDVHSGSNSAWFNKYSTGESAISSPLLSNGAGTATFWVKAASGTPTNWYALETSTDGSNWVLRDSIRANLTAASWTQFTGTVNRSESSFLRVRVTNELPNSIITKFDDLAISYPPARVAVSNVIVDPGYPSVTDPVFVSCDIASVSQPFAAFGITSKLWYRIGTGGVTNGPIPMNPMGGGRYRSATAIPAQPVANTIVAYSIQVDFSGYYGSDAERKSPFFYPGGTNAQTWSNYQDWTNYPCPVRRGQSSYSGVDVLANNSTLSLDLISPYQWQGVFTIATLTNQVLIAMQGLNPYTTNGAIQQYGQTITLGDSTQWKTNAPIFGTMQTNGNAFAMQGALQGQYVLQYNEQSGQYTLRACAYQDFNAWPSGTNYVFGSADTTPPVSPGFSLWGTNSLRNRYQTFVDPTTWYPTVFSSTIAFNGANNTDWGVVQCQGPTNSELYTRNSANNGYLACHNRNAGEDWHGVGTISMSCRLATNAASSATVGIYLCPTNLSYGDSGNWLLVTNYTASNSAVSLPFSVPVNTSATMAVIMAHLEGNESVFFKEVNATEWYAESRTVSVSRAENFTGSPWTTVPTYTNGLISPTTDYGIYACKITSNGATFWAETVATNYLGYVVQANRDLGLVGVGTLQVTAWAPTGTVGLAVYLAPLNQYTNANRSFWGSPVWTNSISGAATNIQIAVNRATNAAVIFAHTSGDLPLRLGALSVTSYDATNAWVASEVWMESNTVSQCRMEASRADPGVSQYLRTPLISDRAIQVAVTWLAGDTNNAAAFEVYATPGNNSTDWGTNKLALSSGLAGGANTNAVTANYLLPLNSTNLFFWVLNTSSNNGVLIIRDVVVTRQRSSSLWLGNNVEVFNQDPADGRAFNGFSCFMNSNGFSEVVSTGSINHVLSDVAPFVQSPMMTNGIGEISFWYRNWATSSVPPPTAMLTVLTSPGGGTNNSGWVTVTNIASISNVNEYLYFTYINYDLTNRYVRIQNNTNPAAGGVGRVCLDNVIVVAPMACDVVLSNLTISPRIPIYTNAVDISIDLANPFLFPSNIQLTAYYQTATNYGGWSGAPNSLAMNCIASNPASRWWRYQTTNQIPTQPPDMFVKYWVGATFQGYLTQATAEHPKTNQEYVTPAWYSPVNFGTSNAYYIVFSCPTGAVWINEFNVVDDTPRNTDWQFAELAGRSGTALGKWSIEIYDSGNASTPYKIYTLTNDAALHNPTNGYGFWLLGMANIIPRDMTFSDIWPTSGGIVLKRSFGAIEQALCYGYDTGILPSHGFTYVGVDDDILTEPMYLYGNPNDGLFWWNDTGASDFTFGRANYNETFPPTPLQTFVLIGSALGNGTVSPASTNVLPGDSAAFVITATNGYRIVTLTTNGVGVTGMTFGNNSTVTNFTWLNVQAAGTLIATFTQQSYTLTSASILSVWLNTNVWIVHTGTNGWVPTPWYATNLAPLPIFWTNVPVFASSYPLPLNGPYTSSFPRMTNSASYFYKIVTTN